MNVLLDEKKDEIVNSDQVEIVLELRRRANLQRNAPAPGNAAQQADNPLIVVLPRMHDVDEFSDDLFNFLGEVPAIFPAWENWPREDSATDPVSGARLRVIRALTSDTPPRAKTTYGGT